MVESALGVRRVAEMHEGLIQKFSDGAQKVTAASYPPGSGAAVPQRLCGQKL
jgi:hypothetical protein